jgi:hypothetical protein
MAGVVRIALADGRVALVDEADASIVRGLRWSVMLRPPGLAYARSSIPGIGRHGRHILMHRLILDAPAGAMVDHINGDGLDNRRANIRVCSARENRQNSRRKLSNVCGFKGVSPSKSKWMARINTEAGQTYLGVFDRPEDAALAYDQAALRIYGQYARLNFQEGCNAR